MAERPTQTITTPENSTVVLYTYLTGREAQEIKNAIFSNLKLTVGQESGDGQQVSGTAIIEQQKLALKYLIVSVNGNTTNPVEVLLDGPASEYEFVVEKANEIVNPTQPPKSSTPGADTSSTAQ